MTVSKKFSIVILNLEKLPETSKIIAEISESYNQSSSHMLFNVEPAKPEDITKDLTFFRIGAENDDEVNEKLKEHMDNLNKIDADYSIRNEETGELISTINSAGSLAIKFDNIKTSPNELYEKIDELKNIKTEFGYCKGYKPQFRPAESNSSKDVFIATEKIYLLSKTYEDLLKQKELMSEKIMEIDCDLEIEFKVFVKDYLEKV